MMITYHCCAASFPDDKLYAVAHDSQTNALLDQQYHEYVLGVPSWTYIFDADDYLFTAKAMEIFCARNVVIPS